MPEDGMLRIFSPEKSDGFRRVWTRELVIVVLVVEKFQFLHDDVVI
jgi:hypothetical protein